VDQTVYHVLLEGRTMGPYDRRTIVGMRIKKALTSDQALVGPDGSRLTVGDLIERKPANSFYASRSASFLPVQASFPAGLVLAKGRGFDIPKFRGEIEARIQGDMLRLAGRYQRWWKLKDGRVKVPLKDVAHAQATGSQVELWLRSGSRGALQQITLELFKQNNAGQLLQWFPAATPRPVPAGAVLAARSLSVHGLWIAVSGTVVVLGLLLMVLLRR
jgi:hypothetical protein